MSSPEKQAENPKSPNAVVPPNAPPELNFGGPSDSLGGLEGGEGGAELPPAEENENDSSALEESPADGNEDSSHMPASLPKADTESEAPTPVVQENSAESVEPSADNASSKRKKGKKLSPEEKAEAVNNEQADRMKNLQMVVDGASSLSKEKALNAVISLIGGLRASLSRQIERMDQRLKKASKAREQYKMLGEYLDSVTEKRATGPGEISEMNEHIKEICKILDVPVPTKTPSSPENSASEIAALEAPVGSGADAVLARAPAGPLLHEQPLAIVRAEPENQLFQKFVRDVQERGVFTGLGEHNTPEILQKCFEMRANVARSIVELYGRERLERLGLPFGLESIGKSVSAYIEKLSLEQPEKIVALGDLIAKNNESAAAVAALEERRARFVSRAELQRVQDKLSEKQKVLELAKASNRFFSGAGRLTGFFARMSGNETLKRQAEARAKAREMGYGTFLGGVSAASEPFGEKLSPWKGKIDAELAGIRKQIQEAGNVGTVQNELLAAKERLAALKSEIMRACGAHNEIAKTFRESVAAAIGKLPTREDIASLEEGEEALMRLHALAEAGGSADANMDYLRSVDTEQVRGLIRSASENKAREVLRSSLEDILQTPQAPGRLLALKAELMALTDRKKLGSFEGQEKVLAFIKEEIQKYYNEALAPTVAEVVKRKNDIDGRNKEKAEADKETLAMTLEEARAVLRARIITDLLNDPLLNPLSPEEPKQSEPRPAAPEVASPEQSPAGVSPEPENLDARLGKIKDLGELKQELSEIKDIEFLGKVAEPPDVVARYLRNIDDALKEGTLLGDIKPDLGCERLFREFIPELNSLASKTQSGLHAAVRRVIIEPLIQEVSGDVLFVAVSALSEKEGSLVREFLTENGKKLFDEEKGRKISYYPVAQATEAQKKIIEAARRIFSRTS